MNVVVVAHNIRSVHNVGSIFRTCEGFGVAKLYLTGYTPYPELVQDKRLPHIRNKLSNQINKTALGAEYFVAFEYHDSITSLILELREESFSIIGLEQTPQSTLLPDFKTPEATALVLGEEVLGIPKEVRDLCDNFVEIPMRGRKESFNVSVATGVALYAITSVV